VCVGLFVLSSLGLSPFMSNLKLTLFFFLI
jgi:hypothetical protein